MAYAVAVSDSPLKGSSPVPVNAIVTAHDHMSAAALARTPASCSGAMNAGVPTATCPESPVVVMPGTAARPKSITTGPSGPSRTLPGLKSRWTIPTACTAPSAVSVATAMRSSTVPLRGPCCCMTSTNDGPLTRSEEHTSELQSRENLVCRLLLEKKKKNKKHTLKKKQKKNKKNQKNR